MASFILKSYLLYLRILTRFNKHKPLLLVTPGPVLLRSKTRQVLSQQSLHHRSDQFKNILQKTQIQLKKLFKTKESVMILTSSGTGAMEAALTNTLSAQDQVLVISVGKFAKRWVEIAKAFNIIPHELQTPWAQALDLKDLKSVLQNNTQIKACLVQACETSTGTEYPIQDIATYLKTHYPNMLLIVDAMTGLGSMPLAMDDWGIDVLISGSQKSLMLPTGLAFIAFSQKAWQAEAKATCPRYYFDLKKEKEATILGQNHFSSNVSLIRALHASLCYIESQSLEQLILRCQKLKESSLLFCKTLGLKLFSARPAAAVTAIELSGINSSQLQQSLKDKYHIQCAGGQSQLKGRICRIGHLGCISNSQHIRVLLCLAAEIKRQKPDVNFCWSQILKALIKARLVLDSKM